MEDSKGAGNEVPGSSKTDSQLSLCRLCVLLILANYGLDIGII